MPQWKEHDGFMKNINILIVDDESSIRTLLSMHLKNNGYQVKTAGDGSRAVKMLQQDIYDVVIADLKIDNVTGQDILRKAKKVFLRTEVIIITGHGTLESAVETMKLGAFDYITKPVDPEELTIIVQKALERQRLLAENENLRSQLRDYYRFENIVAVSPGMQQVLEMVKRIANSDATVLIEGESGTGKEVIAKSIHNNSYRSKGPFVAINCGAMPETLLESELFGHMRGAFTGANTTKKGLFEEACHGTIFLDEVGETTQTFQVKLLRVLQENEIRRVGDTKDIPIDVHVLAASNRPLRQLVDDGQFRKDLYYRLRVLPLFIPPLRDRREDIIPLADFFVEQYSERTDKPKAKISKEARKKMESFSWPGNVRELENTIERAMVLVQGDELKPDDIFLEPQTVRGENHHLIHKSLKEIEKDHIRKVLEDSLWNQTEASQRLGIGYNTLWRKIREYKIEK
jgi:DNA-binding NtrC family response regulator